MGLEVRPPLPRAERAVLATSVPGVWAEPGRQAFPLISPQRRAAGAAGGGGAGMALWRLWVDMELACRPSRLLVALWGLLHLARVAPVPRLLPGSLERAVAAVEPRPTLLRLARVERAEIMERAAVAAVAPTTVSTAAVVALEARVSSFS